MRSAMYAMIFLARSIRFAFSRAFPSGDAMLGKRFSHGCRIKLTLMVSLYGIWFYPPVRSVRRWGMDANSNQRIGRTEHEQAKNAWQRSQGDRDHGRDTYP